MATIVCCAVGCSFFGSAPEVTRDLRAPGVESCPVHNVALREGFEKITASPPNWDADYFDARRKLFPYAMTGDLVDQDATRAHVLYCPECRLARAHWLEKQQ